jgi:hypothetical protein
LGAIPALHAAELLPDVPDTYRVRPADILWSITARFLRSDLWRWREVWQANADVASPNLIYPGDVLRVTRVNSRPRIGVDRGGATVVGHRGGMQVVKLSPRVRSSPLMAAIPTISIAAIGPFLSQPDVAESNQINAAPYVVGFPGEHIVAGAGDFGLCAAHREC